MARAIGNNNVVVPVKVIELSSLPKRKMGSKEVIDWKNIRENEVYFEYGSIKGHVKVSYSHTEKGSVGNNMHYLEVKFGTKSLLMADSNFRKVKFGTLLEDIIVEQKNNKDRHKFDGWVTRKMSGYKYEIGQTIEKKSSKFKIKSSFRNKDRNNKAYLVECLSCREEFEGEEYGITNMKVCPICHNSDIREGVNTVSVTHPWLKEYALNPEVLDKHSYGSLKKVVVQCPICLTATNIPISRAIGHGVPCSCKSSSLGEQVLEACLRANNVRYKREYNIDGTRKRYDFYLPDHTMIVEIHGTQHFKANESRTDLEQIQQNDIEKEDRAKELGYTYIELNWSHENTQEFLGEVRDKIPFINIVDLYQQLDSIPSLKKVVSLWERFPYNTRKIQEGLEVGDTSRKKLLKQAGGLGLINYNSVRAQSKGNVHSVVCLNERKVFKSIIEASEAFDVDRSAISGNCKHNVGKLTRFKSAGKHPITKEKMQWMFLEDYKNIYGEEGLAFI